jgi:hypothetical protein
MRAFGNGDRITWFEFGIWLFAVALPVGLVLALVAPVEFMHVLGAVVIGISLIGLWVCALGLQLEHPQRWLALKASARRLASSTS